jgi:hypothetical protein
MMPRHDVSSSLASDRPAYRRTRSRDVARTDRPAVTIWLQVRGREPGPSRKPQQS